MKLYLVQRQGIRWAGIVGIFRTQEKAEQAAQDAIRTELDTWHDYHVQTIETDKVYMPDVTPYGSSSPDLPTLVVFRRDKQGNITRDTA